MAEKEIIEEEVWKVGDCKKCPDGELLTDGRDVWCDVCDFIDVI